MSHPDVVVVGAGIVGAACAEALARDGLRVLVLEAGYAGGGTTAAAMGHVVVMDDSPAQLALTAGSRRLWEERLGELPADCEDDPAGTLWVAADEAEMALVRSKAALYGTAGVATEILDERGLREAEPALRPGLVGALRVPGDRVVYPPNAARFFLEGARSHGASVSEGTRVQALGPGRVVTSQGDVEAGLVVNAAGTWAGELTPGLPVEPRKGHLVISARAPGFLRHQVVELGYL
jgi:glycine/D-amino acid oxidase-like deaminating enzyme